MKNFKHLTYLLQFCHAICLFPLCMNISKNKMFFYLKKKFYFLRIFLIDVLFIGYIVKNTGTTLLTKNIRLNEVVFIFCSIPIIITILDIQIMGYFTRNKYQKLLVALYNINATLNKFGKEPIYYKILLQPIFVLFYFIYLFAIYYVYYSMDEAFTINFGYTLAKFMIFSSTCIYVNLLGIIKGYFIRLTHLLSSSEDLDLVYPIYKELMFLCKKMNKLFGHQLLLTILTYLIWTIYEMYHLVIVWPCINCQRFLIKLAISYTVIQEVLIFTILWNCQSTQMESERFKTMWYSILIKKINKINQRRLESYSLRLINYKVVFTAMGLYVLDMEHFFSVLTYYQ